MTDAGRLAYEQWKSEYGPPAPAPATGILPKLPGPQHDAVLAAARRPDHLAPGIDDHVPGFFNRRTLAAVRTAGYADMRPCEHGVIHGTWEQTGRAL
ncbi:hypothetical protein [Actinacidiphila sp. ITFR-21]|uniref:hypothetical protein n=1 Tax=Actinacidiphila sp. ITFR-21 TaxID=3075199 RepID=UPI002889BA02|nr:hypothetical protein [Streptomyces sp. ITFR-21]WNI18099.1 hypothetical protein RLT57_22825 [Streptomyces sp. ITFR-21]